jgi:hypothetical protein
MLIRRGLLFLQTAWVPHASRRCLRGFNDAPTQAKEGLKGGLPLYDEVLGAKHGEGASIGISRATRPRGG